MEIECCCRDEERAQGEAHVNYRFGASVEDQLENDSDWQSQQQDGRA